MICIKNMGIYHSFEKNETATMFFLKKPSLVITWKEVAWKAQVIMCLHGIKKSCLKEIGFPSISGLYISFVYFPLPCLLLNNY